MVKRSTLLLMFFISACVPVFAALPEAPVLSPSGLDADGGDGKVYLEWNPNTEPDATGYNVYRWPEVGVYRWPEAGKERTRLNDRPIAATVYTDASARNDVSYCYAVTAVYKDGETRPSAAATARPAKVAPVKMTHGAPSIPATATRPEVKFGNVFTFEFANGHSIVFDKERMKWCDWRSPDGRHLLYPRPYGNPIDLCSYNNFGFSETQPATALTPPIPPRINLNYLPEFEGRVAARWLGHGIDGQRVTLSYRIPLWGPGLAPDTKHDSWIWATIRETWFPVERKIGGTAYAGLARRIELDIPSFYNQAGFSMALNAGIASGGDIILVPEIPYTIEGICRKINARLADGRLFSIIVAAEGARSLEGGQVIKERVNDPSMPIRLGGVGGKVADDVEDATGIESRVTVLGHLQRGGTPTAFDRILATRFGALAADLIARGEHGKMVALKGNEIVAVPLEAAVAGPKLIDPESSIIRAARDVGTSFGDE